MRVFLDAALYISFEGTHLTGEKVATVYVLLSIRTLTFSCAGMHSIARRSVLVIIVALSILDQRK